MAGPPCDGWGTVTMWGFSPALDFQDDVCHCGCLSRNKQHSTNGRCDEKLLDVVNILMIGAGDCRHILKTMAQRNRHKKRKIHIYVAENNLELIGRHLLMLTLALEPQRKMGLQEKADLFVELYGNTLIRQQTLQYLQEKASLFIEMVTDLDYADERMPSIDLSQLKFKERDYLEGVFKFWRDPDPRSFMVNSMWDSRLRQYLNRRYDSRSGAFDWDLMMKLHEHGAKMICKPEYVRWREKGVAFETREGIYDKVNKTMATRAVMKRRDGEKGMYRGYWGDMITGPYIAFGIDSHEKSLLKTNNGKHITSSSEISLYNLTSMFHEISTHKPYTGSAQEDCSRIMEVDDEDDENEDDFIKKAGSREFYAATPCEEICVHFLPFNCIDQLHEKNKFQGFFNHTFISASMAVVLKSTLKPIFAPHATLTVELVKYIIDLNKTQVNNFTESVTSMAETAGFKPLIQTEESMPTSTAGCFAKFVLAEEGEGAASN